MTAWRRCWTLVALLVPALLWAAPAPGGLTPAEQRGKRIYATGEGRHPITALLPSAGFEAPGSSFTCIGCHRAGGVGQLEGGVQSSDITWPLLTKEFSGKRPSGRAHPPYDEIDLANAITDGVDPALNELHLAHPHYTLHPEDLDDLIAYMKVMHEEPVPGVSSDAVRVGMLLPTRGPLAEAGEAVRALLAGQFAEVSAHGGFYHRSLELVPLPFDPAVEGAALAAARGVVEAGEVFCFLGNVGLAPADETLAYLEEEKVPVLVPLLTAPESGYEAGRYTFHVLPSIRDQARVLVDFAVAREGAPTGGVALLYAEDASGRGGAAGAREQAAKHGLALGPELGFAPGALDAPAAVARLRAEGVGTVLYFGGPREAAEFGAEAERRAWRPWFLALATTAGSALQAAPAGFLPAVYLAYPFQPPETASPRLEEFFALGRKYGVGEEHRLFQLLAYAGAILLEEGLKRTGKAVTRENFVDAIGDIWRFETGVTPPLTYTPNRRSGTVGAAVVGVDATTRRLLPVAPWREPQ